MDEEPPSKLPKIEEDSHQLSEDTFKSINHDHVKAWNDSVKLGDIFRKEWFSSEKSFKKQKGKYWSTFKEMSNDEDFRYIIQKQFSINVVELVELVEQLKEEGKGAGTERPQNYGHDVKLAPDKTKPMPDLVTGALKNNRPKDLLLHEIQRLDKNKGAAPFLALVQSSGYGKTRTVLELAKTRRVVYLLCTNITGGWQRPPVMDLFVKHILQHENSDNKVESAKVFLQSVLKTTQKYESAESLYNAQFTEDGSFSTFYDELNTTYDTFATPSTSESLGEEVLSSAEQSERLVIVFDESKVLAEDERPSCKSSYRCIRSVLGGAGMIGVFLDTFGSINLFMPEGADSDRSTGIGVFQPPLFEIDTFDEFGAEGYLFMGRPLWRMQWKYRFENDCDALVQFAGHKLARLSSGPPISDDGKVALFLCRYGLNPSGDLAKRLVASHMATLLGVSVDRKHLLTTYKSEPILAEASAYLTSFGDVQVNDVLNTINGQIKNKVLRSSKGDRGEIAAAAWFGYTLDYLRRDQSSDRYKAGMFSQDVAVEDFIKALFPSNVKIGEDACKHLQDWKINVTHFCRLGYSPPRNCLEIAWSRHVGFYMPEGEQGVDIVLPACNTKTNVKMAVRVQVKNYKNPISEKSQDDLFQKLDIRRCSPVTKFEEEPVSIAILVQVGAGYIMPRVRVHDLGRSTRRVSASSLQVQVSCSMEAVSDSFDFLPSLRLVGGDSKDQIEFTLSSDHFQRGELMEGFEGEEQQESDQ